MPYRLDILISLAPMPFSAHEREWLQSRLACMPPPPPHLRLTGVVVMNEQRKLCEPERGMILGREIARAIKHRLTMKELWWPNCHNFFISTQVI